jgi:2,4-dienoyl-CoA reductase-like NADH-dependent reductase (Old Yellow Enzyme family)
MDLQSTDIGKMNQHQPAVAALLAPLTIRGVTLRNRIALPPMCQYSASEGMANDWHLVHLGSRAIGGAALVIAEATAVARDGRITPGDLGLWSDDHIAPLARIVQFIESHGAVPGIQLAHAGRKGTKAAPWLGGNWLTPAEGGWPVMSASAVPFDNAPVPAALDKAGIDEVVAQFEAAAQRAVAAGFKVIEVHSAHGYLIHQFLSPISNRRDDDYGGSFENRTRLLVRIATSIRAAIPAEVPLFVRISATDWLEGEPSWDIEQSVALARLLKAAGVDLIDVSSGGSALRQKPALGKGYQVPFARRIRVESGIMTGAVGLITEAQHANEVIADGSADLVFVGRAFLREAYWGLHAVKALGGEPSWPKQYGYAVG